MKDWISVNARDDVEMICLIASCSSLKRHVCSEAVSCEEGIVCSDCVYDRYVNFMRRTTS